MATQTPPTTPTDGGNGALPPDPPRPTMTVYGGGRPPKRPRRRWVRIALWSTAGILVVLAAVVGVVSWWLYGDYSHLTNLSAPQKAAAKELQQLPSAQSPAIALIIGSDHRFADGTAPSRSDTLMLARIDPQRHLISLLSIPRDLYVDIPGYGRDKINAAYSDGQDKLAVETVKQLTGLKINYEINVDFHGFMALVNDLGGVYLSVDQRYYHSQAGVAPGSADSYSAINLQPGYQLLSGKNALAFARYRHTDSDFYRTARQQLFLRAFEQRASGRFHGISVTDLGAIHNVVDDISGNVTVVGLPGGLDGVRTLLRFATSAYQTRGHIVSVKLAAQSATGPGGASIVVPDSPTSIKQAVYAFKHPQLLLKTAGGLPSAPTKPAHKKHRFKPAVTPSTVPVAILNGTTKAGEAGTTATALGGFGYPTTSGNAPSQTYARTVIYYRPGFVKAAGDLARIMGKGQVAKLPATISASSGSVVVILGTDFSGRLAIKPPKAAPTSRYPPTITPDSQVFLNDFRTAAHRARMNRFPGLYPTVTQASSQLVDLTPGPVRTYTIPYKGHHWASMYAEYQLTTTVGGYWGIEETRFTQAPILANPQATRTLDGRKYLFYTDGPHIHMIAFVQHGAAYWVVNTLLDELTNPEMIAIARSLKPTG